MHTPATVLELSHTSDGVLGKVEGGGEESEGGVEGGGEESEGGVEGGGEESEGGVDGYRYTVHILEIRGLYT
jgi:hypothetical protein